MKKISKLLCFMVAFITVMAAFCTVSFAATIGQPLTSPESGWQRINDTDTHIKYIGSQWSLWSNDSNWFNNDCHITGAISDVSSTYLTFKFKGTKIRVIASPNTNQPNRMDITIDGVTESYSQNGPLTKNALVYEKQNLTNTVHSVIVKSNSASNTRQLLWDAIDIDETGYLVDISTPDAPTNLNAISGNKKVDLSWGSVEGAASYNVKRALTAGGPYTTIATTSAITYIDSNVSNDVKYYYVISAVVSGTESPNSNEASATPTAPEVIGNPGILEITMTNGQIKEYDLSGAELLAFLNWYDGKSDGTGKAYYTITKKNNIKPFLSRKEYIAFDKISSFEVKEYTE